jgi:hypothetical protein
MNISLEKGSYYLFEQTYKYGAYMDGCLERKLYFILDSQIKCVNEAPNLKFNINSFLVFDVYENREIGLHISRVKEILKKGTRLE